jgi:hypothetical protein
MDIEAARRRYEGQLMKLPNVTGVGIGEKAGKKVVKVFVTLKVPRSSLRPEDTVPERVDEWETDVEEMGVVTTQPR